MCIYIYISYVYIYLYTLFIYIRIQSHIIIYIYTYTYTYIHIHIHIFTHTHIYIYTYTYVYIYIYIYVYICMFMRINAWCLHVNVLQRNSSVCHSATVGMNGNCKNLWILLRSLCWITATQVNPILMYNRLYGHIYTYIYMYTFIYLFTLGASTENAPKRMSRKAVSDTIAGVKGFKAPPSGEDEADPSHLLIKGLAPEIDPCQHLVEPHVALAYNGISSMGKYVVRWVKGHHLVDSRNKGWWCYDQMNFWTLLILLAARTVCATSFWEKTCKLLGIAR